MAAADYRTSAASIRACGNTISRTSAGEVLRKAGELVKKKYFGLEAFLKAHKEAPPNPASLLILEADGSRYRTNADDRRGPDSSAPVEEWKKGWRENKVGVVIRALPGVETGDGRYEPPKELVKTYVAGTGDIRAFGDDLATEARRRGLEGAASVVFVSDNGHGIPKMVARLFPEVERVTDFYHCTERLAECAKAHVGEEDEAGRRAAYRELQDSLWKGEVEGVVERIRGWALERAPCPENLSDPASPRLREATSGRDSDAKVLWGHVKYFEKYKDTMDYPRYREHGWPMGSGAVESACGQIGDRVKHGRMRWTETGADAMHSVKAAIMSQDGRWEKMWPTPIPTIDLTDLILAA